MKSAEQSATIDTPVDSVTSSSSLDKVSDVMYVDYICKKVVTAPVISLLSENPEFVTPGETTCRQHSCIIRITNAVHQSNICDPSEICHPQIYTSDKP